jgi:succinate dehydrogenase / fumarate reductase, cytochrome b subunit
LTAKQTEFHNKRFAIEGESIKDRESEVASVITPVARGVPPLRAGQGHSFFWRRLHSLSGIIPIGAFLLEHFISNAFATNGPHAYADQVRFLTGLPFVTVLEWVGIYIPLLYHSLYGFYIWFRGESNVRDYPWAGNFMYAAQRWTGAIAFLYMGWHVYTMRIAGTHLLTHPDAAFGKVQTELQVWWAGMFYVIGITAASWHFAYGLYLFCAKWGITESDRSRRAMGVVSTVIAITLIAVGMLTLRAFFNPAWKNTPEKLPAESQVMQSPGQI